MMIILLNLSLTYNKLMTQLKFLFLKFDKNIFH